jgi:hypothetical protein
MRPHDVKSDCDSRQARKGRNVRIVLEHLDSRFRGNDGICTTTHCPDFHEGDGKGEVCGSVSFRTPHSALGNAFLYDFATSTGHAAWPITFSVTLPIRSLRRPVLPWEPMTIMSTAWSLASFMIASQDSASPT